MKWNRVLMYLVILVIVVGYLYGVEIKQKDKKQTEESEAQKLVHLDKEKVVAVQLESADRGKIELRKPADAWVLTAPVKAKGDGAAVGSLVQSATDAKSEKVILEKDVKWDEYGLDKPEFTVTLFTKDDKQTELSFGAANPAKTSYYARVDDQPRLLLVADTLKNSLNKTPFDLRDKSVLTMPPEDVDQVVISKHGIETELKREAPDRWIMVTPERTRVKSSLMAGNIKSITGLSAKDIIDEPRKDGDPYGLDNPQESYQLTGSQLEQTLEIGKPADKKEGSPQTQTDYYARVKGQDTVYLIDGRALSMMKTDPQSLKDRSVLSFGPNDIEKIDVELDGKTWVAVRQADKKWNLEKPEKREKMDSWLVSSMLWDLRDLEWKSLIRPIPADLASVNLDKPRFLARFYKQGETEPIVLKAGWQNEQLHPEKANSAEATKNVDKKETKSESATPQEAALPDKEIPKTVNAVAQPQEEQAAILVLDGAFVAKLRGDLQRLTEKD
ncbi:MAG TPA: DUF4340 domain-containing protein [Desulfomonilaceae bacterium]|nr:DUF4340 domain-containing protein [Desulfomonilaceae bacterium]